MEGKWLGLQLMVDCFANNVWSPRFDPQLQREWKKKGTQSFTKRQKKKKSQNQRQTWSDSKNSEPFALKPV